MQQTLQQDQDKEFFFRPTIAINKLSTEEDKARARTLCSLVEEKDVPLINRQVAAAFVKESRTWPMDLLQDIQSNLTVSLHEKWLLTHYYDIVKNVLDEKNSTNEEGK